MSASKSNEIIWHIEQYVSGQLSRSGYRAWLVDAVWNAESSDTTHQTNILYALEALDAEFTSGAWTEDELKDELKDRYLVNRFNVASA